MKFEDILPGLRNGAKAYNSDYDLEGEYWIAGYVCLGDEHGEGDRTLSLHRLNKDGKAFVDKNSWGMPRWLIMSDQWEFKQ